MMLIWLTGNLASLSFWTASSACSMLRNTAMTLCSLMMLSSRLERRRRRVSKEKDPRAHDDDDQQGADHGEPQGVDTARLSLLLVLVFFLQVFFVLAFLFVVLV